MIGVELRKVDSLLRYVFTFTFINVFTFTFSTFCCIEYFF